MKPQKKEDTSGSQPQTLEERLDRLDAAGLLVSPSTPRTQKLRPVARRPNALQRFFGSRERITRKAEDRG